MDGLLPVVPTVLGWPGHEHQWRGTLEAFAGREADVETIYRTPDSDEASRLLDKYGVTYVVAGPRERSQYGAAPLGKFDKIGDRVFENNGTLIFRIRE